MTSTPTNPVYDGTHTPINQAARTGMTAPSPTEPLTGALQIADDRWGPNRPPLTLSTAHLKNGHYYNHYLHRTFGRIKVLGFNPDPDDLKLLVVQCHCQRYATLRPRTLRVKRECTACQLQSSPYVPYKTYTDKPPRLTNLTDRGQTHNTITVLGRRHGKFMVKCNCGAIFTAKNPARCVCHLCRDYVHGPLDVRKDFPKWWPVNQEVLKTLDPIRERLILMMPIPPV